MSAEGSHKQWLPNGKLLLLSLTKCLGVPCSLQSRITTKVLKNCKFFSSRPRPRPRPNVQDQDQDFMIQDQDFHFCPRGASIPRPWSRGLHHCIIMILKDAATFQVLFYSFYLLCLEHQYCGDQQWRSVT